MSVDVEIENLQLFTYYSDDRSKMLAELFQNNQMLAEYKVRRQRIAGDQDSDPFIVLDPQDNELVYLEECEVDALGDSQLLSYVKGRIEINQIEGAEEIIVIIPILFVSLFATLLIVTALNPTLLTNLVFISVLLVLPVLATVSGYLSYRRLKVFMFFRRELIAAMVDDNPTFLDSLRLLAEQSEAKGLKNKAYRRELQYYEDMIAKINRF